MRSVALIVVLLAIPAIARADDAAPPASPISIAWSAPAGCPDAAAVRAETTRLLGGPPDRDSPRRVSARARVSRARGRWQLEVQTETDGAIGERRLEADGCAALADAAALIVAMAFDPDAVVEARRAREGGAAKGDEPIADPPPEPPAPLVVAPPGPPTPPSLGAALSPPPRGMELRSEPAPAKTALLALAGVDAVLDAGALPRAAFGLSPTLGLLLHRMRGEVSATLWLSQRAEATDRPSAGGTFSFFSGALSGGAALLLLPVEVGPIVGFEVGRIHAKGYGVTRPGSGGALWAAARAGLFAAVPLSPGLALRIQGSAVVPTARPRWILENVGAVDRPGPVSARGALGLELRL